MEEMDVETTPSNAYKERHPSRMERARAANAPSANKD